MVKIKEMRKKFGYSQQKLAELLGGDISQSAISQWETGANSPPQHRITQLAEIFGVGESELMSDVVKQKTSTPGEEGMALTDTEKHLLACFRSVGEDGRRMILSVADLEYERRRAEIVG